MRGLGASAGQGRERAGVVSERLLEVLESISARAWAGGGPRRSAEVTQLLAAVLTQLLAHRRSHSQIGAAPSVGVLPECLFSEGKQ